MQAYSPVSGLPACCHGPPPWWQQTLTLWNCEPQVKCFIYKLSLSWCFITVTDKQQRQAPWWAWHPWGPWLAPRINIPLNPWEISEAMASFCAAMANLQPPWACVSSLWGITVSLAHAVGAGWGRTTWPCQSSLQTTVHGLKSYDEQCCLHEISAASEESSLSLKSGLYLGI